MEAVSVVIPAFNRKILLQAAIESVLAALQPADELIVVDDGSTDGTDEMVRIFGERIRYVKTVNRGAGAARNSGIELSCHDLVAFADSDDLWAPQKLAIQRPLMSLHRDIVFSFTEFGQQYADGTRINHQSVTWHKDRRTWDAILGPGRRCSELLPLPGDHADCTLHMGTMYRNELHANYINVNTLVVRKSLAGERLRFAEDLPTYEDWDCFARLTKLSPCAFLDLDTAYQRAHEGARLTDASILTRTQTRIVCIERNWGVDREFMARHGKEVNDLLAQLRSICVRQLIRLGRIEESRAYCHGLRWGYAQWAALLMIGTAKKILRRSRVS